MRSELTMTLLTEIRAGLPAQMLNTGVRLGGWLRQAPLGALPTADVSGMDSLSSVLVIAALLLLAGLVAIRDLQLGASMAKRYS